MPVKINPARIENITRNEMYYEQNNNNWVELKALFIVILKKIVKIRIIIKRQNVF